MKTPTLNVQVRLSSSRRIGSIGGVVHLHSILLAQYHIIWKLKQRAYHNVGCLGANLKRLLTDQQGSGIVAHTGLALVHRNDAQILRQLQKVDSLVAFELLNLCDM
jgi:hypothetical protein